MIFAPYLKLCVVTGKLREEDGDDEEESFEDEMMEEESNTYSENTATDVNVTDEPSTNDEQELVNVTPKLFISNTKNSSSGMFVEENVVTKPDLSEIHKQSNRETLSYLKAKRINRHKTANEIDAKKIKMDE